MKLLAPLVITLLISGGLYMNREIWSVANYKSDVEGSGGFGRSRYGGGNVKGQFTEAGYDQYRSREDFGGEARFPKGADSPSQAVDLTSAKQKGGN